MKENNYRLILIITEQSPRKYAANRSEDSARKPIDNELLIVDESEDSNIDVDILEVPLENTSDQIAETKNVEPSGFRPILVRPDGRRLDRLSFMESARLVGGVAGRLRPYLSGISEAIESNGTVTFETMGQIINSPGFPRDLVEFYFESGRSGSRLTWLEDQAMSFKVLSAVSGAISFRAYNANMPQSAEIIIHNQHLPFWFEKPIIPGFEWVSEPGKIAIAKISPILSSLLQYQNEKLTLSVFEQLFDTNLDFRNAFTDLCGRSKRVLAEIRFERIAKHQYMLRAYANIDGTEKRLNGFRPSQSRFWFDVSNDQIVRSFFEVAIPADLRTFTQWIGINIPLDELSELRSNLQRLSIFGAEAIPQIREARAEFRVEPFDRAFQDEPGKTSTWTHSFTVRAYVTLDGIKVALTDLTPVTNGSWFYHATSMTEGEYIHVLMAAKYNSIAKWLNKKIPFEKIGEIGEELKKFAVPGADLLPPELKSAPMILIMLTPKVKDQTFHGVYARIKIVYALNDEILHDFVQCVLEGASSDVLNAFENQKYVFELEFIAGNTDIIIPVHGKIIRRSPSIEVGLLQEMPNIFNHSLNEPGNLIDLNRLGTFVNEDLPNLNNNRYLITIPDNIASLLAPIPQNRQLKIEIHSSGIDWLGKFAIADMSREDVKLIAEAAMAEKDYVMLTDGRWVSLQQYGVPRILEFLEKINAQYDAEGTKGPLNLVAEELRASPDVRLDETLKTFYSALLAIAPEVHDTNSDLHNTGINFKAELREYQKIGVAFFSKLYRLNAGGILADEMGLGKTIQALAFLNQLDSLADQPSLLVCPLSALDVWRSEAAKFCPRIKTIIWPGQTGNLGDFPHDGLVLTTFERIHNQREIFGRVKFDVMLVDEAQRVKNPHGVWARTLFDIQAKSKFCITGTPIENSLIDLWSLMKICFPGCLGTDLELFRQRYVSKNTFQNMTELQGLIKPFVLRRTKIDVAKEVAFPPCEIREELVPMTAQQRTIYEVSRLNAIEKLNAKNANPIMNFLPELMKLRRIACHPNVKDPSKSLRDSGKILYIEKFLEDNFDKMQGVLIFSQFTDVLGIVRTFLEESGYRYLYLDGKTDPSERTKVVRKFQKGERKIFLISLRSGGTALTLTQADTVIHLDPWWNPAVERQATDRAHRIGQDKKVTVYKLIAQNTIEEKVVRLQLQKQTLIEQFFGDSVFQKNSVNSITREEFMKLLDA